MNRESLAAQAHALLAAASPTAVEYDFAKRAKALSEALVLFRELGDEGRQALVLARLGNAALNAGDYAAALEYFHESEDMTARLGDRALGREVRGNLVSIFSDLGEHRTALQLAEEELALDADSPDPEIRLMALNLLGCVLAAMGRHEEGVARLRESNALVDAIPDSRQRTHLHSQSMADLSDALLKSGMAGEALVHARDGAQFARSIDHPPLVMLNTLYAGRAALALGRFEEAAQWLASAAELAAQMGLRPQETKARLELANAFDCLNRPGEALASYRKGHAIEREIRHDEAVRRIELRRTKRAIDDAQREQESAERVLFTVLPHSIAKRVKEGEGRIADDVRDASVLFADLVGFTALSARIAPRELLGVLECLFSEFDRLTAAHGLEKVKTIGDAYMAVGGALAPSNDHVQQSARLGMAMIAAVERIGAEMGFDFAIRVGLHVGPAIAGVIGTQRLSYDLWGETVNLASRLESAGIPGRIHVSSAVADRLRGMFAMQPRGQTALKGFGELPTFLLA